MGHLEYVVWQIIFLLVSSPVDYLHPLLTEQVVQMTNCLTKKVLCLSSLNQQGILISQATSTMLANLGATNQLHIPYKTLSSISKSYSHKP